MTTINTLKMAAKGQKIRSLIGRRAAAESSYNGRLEGVIESIAYNLYPVIRLTDGRTFRADSTIELI
jgi:hypothetical protein